tara:strand:- start:12306 stop:12659 length:354 start_codon:yes stop_codon:yes gene_type:complete
MSRYGLRDTIENSEKRYKNILKERGVKTIKHYAAPKFVLLSDEQIQDIRVHPIIWKLGTRFYKLADKEYGDPNLWWVIAFYNRKPTDFHVTLGETVFVPENWRSVYNAVVEPDGKYT